MIIIKRTHTILAANSVYVGDPAASASFNGFTLTPQNLRELRRHGVTAIR